MKTAKRFLLQALVLLLLLPSLAQADLFEEPELVQETAQEALESAITPSSVETYSIAVSMNQFADKNEVDDFLQWVKDNEIKRIIVGFKDLTTGCTYYNSPSYLVPTCEGYANSNNLLSYLTKKAVSRFDLQVYGAMSILYDPQVTKKRPDFRMQALQEDDLLRYVDGWITPFRSRTYNHLLQELKGALNSSKDLSGFVFTHFYFPETGADLSEYALRKLEKDLPNYDWRKLKRDSEAWPVFVEQRSKYLADLLDKFKKVARGMLPEGSEVAVVLPSDSVSTKLGYSNNPDNGIDFAKIAQIPQLRIMPIINWQTLGADEEEALAEAKNRINLLNNQSLYAPITVLEHNRGAFGTYLTDSEYETFLGDLKEYLISQYLGDVSYYQSENWDPTTLTEVGNMTGLAEDSGSPTVF